MAIVPVSQLVLPVGATGLMVNGNIPNPEPSRIIRNINILEKQFHIYMNTHSYESAHSSMHYISITGLF